MKDKILYTPDKVMLIDIRDSEDYAESHIYFGCWNEWSPEPQRPANEEGFA
ncbi:MAG TPA: hypothetical protein VK971_09225 [Thiohalobacter sp.]|nr:hypothetical protein [Thiohalobacter sp.]